jgi:anti-sigma B factor antagonist
VRIHERSLGTVTILAVDGRLAANDQPGLLKRTVEDVARRGGSDVVIDLSGVGYVDSTRLGELIAAQVTISRVGGRLKLAGVPPRVWELLRLSGLDRVFDSFDTVEEASSSLQEE